MHRQPPRTTRTSTLFPSTPLFRSEHDQIDILRRAPGRSDCGPARSSRQRRCGFLRSRDVAEADAGALDDPFVRGIHGLGEFGVRDAPRGQRRAGADDDRTNHHAASARTLPRSSMIRRVRSSRTILAAAPIAVATPSSVAPPWLFRSEEHTSELQSLMRISYAVFCLKKKIHHTTRNS